jgi:hypothetical protein
MRLTRSKESKFGSGRGAPPGKGQRSDPRLFDDKIMNYTCVQACKHASSKTNLLAVKTRSRRKAELTLINSRP